MNTIIKGAALLAFIISPAFAQSASSQNQSGTNLQNQSGTASQVQSGSQSSMTDGLAAAQKIKQDLQNAGFTNVQIMAESFVVQAKSKNGDPVVMTIGPHGMSVFEAMENSGGSSGSSPSTSGSASSTSGMNNSTGTNSTTGSVDSRPIRRTRAEPALRRVLRPMILQLIRTVVANSTKEKPRKVGGLFYLP